MLQAILRWTRSNVKTLRRSQCTTLAYMVMGLMSGGRAGVASMGRHLPGAAYVKHKIKRVDRFLGNGRLRSDAVGRALLSWGVWAGRRLVLAVDWTDLPGGKKMLTAAIPTRGRAVPVWWRVVEPEAFERISQNRMEERFLADLCRALPKGVEAVVVADRGFGRTSLMKYLKKLGLRFVLRVKGDAVVRHHGIRERVEQAGILRGQTEWWRKVLYRDEEPVVVNMVLRWRGTMKEPWYLVTDLEEAPREIVALYGRRMQIEESFRDTKSVRWGFKLRHVRLGSAERFERLMMVVALAYLFLMSVGLKAEMDKRHRRHMANTAKKRTLSWLSLGRACLKEYAATLRRCLHTLRHLLAEA